MEEWDFGGKRKEAPGCKAGWSWRKMGMGRLFATASMMQGDWNQPGKGSGLFVAASVACPGMTSSMASYISFNPDTGKVPWNLRRT